ncbi:MAG: hypothetical protein ACI4KG_00230 [Oscillospiraceae bacterium]
MYKLKFIAAFLACGMLFCGCNDSKSGGDEALSEQLSEDITEAAASDSETDKDDTQNAESLEAQTEERLYDASGKLKGYWINIDSPYEQWIFNSDGTVEIAGEEHSFSALYNGYNDYDIRLIIDGINEYTVFKYYIYDDCLELEKDGEQITLYPEGSDEVKEARRFLKFKETNAELFEKYPDNDGWMEYRDYGDIPTLADAAYIESSVEQGVFLVSTPEELASFNYYVNTSPEGQYLLMQLQNDIDLEGYEWVPMGWSGGQNDHPFTCLVDGNGCTIKNMKIISGGTDIGFIGWETFCYVGNITFENAFIDGGNDVGIITGQAICGSYENCHVSGEVYGRTAGSMLGYEANCSIKDCTADVIVNDEKFDFISWNEKEKSEIVIEDPVEITIDENHTVTRPEVEGYYNLGWMVFYNGEQVLHRNAEGELSYRYFLEESGTYEIYLSAYVSGQYVPISNTVTYTIE